ncbi:MAG TPA: 50S ribosomal protein L23 [Thermodesulfobacteriota bacterium]|nr:50S ribosomal protein L23 [Deltaproteobacteria bacterium]HLB05765.1 50S ribosomal protein L23 [Thermodesulfobacteriota bacterium]
MSEVFNILKRPLLTEKGTDQKEAFNKYLFEVDKCANKIEIKNAVEKIFSVKVDDVHTVNVKGKVKRVGRNFGKRSDWKKAVVTLKAGEKIEIIEGV